MVAITHRIDAIFINCTEPELLSNKVPVDWKCGPLFEGDICEAIKVSTCINARNSYGGTSPTQVARELALGKETLLLQRQVVEKFSQAASV